MGRAIDVQKNIDLIKIKVEKLENQLRGMVAKLDEFEEAVDELYDKSSKTKHIDLTEVKNETKEEKTNDEGNGKSSKSANTAKPKPSKKNK